MRVLIWVTTADWQACVDAASRHAGDADAEFRLVAVIDTDALALASHPGPGRFGRRRDGPPDAAGEVDLVAEDAARALLVEARERLGRPDAELRVLRGRVEHAVAADAEDADLLICARDGEDRRGPKSFGRRSRFVVDHAACDVLLVWADDPASRAEKPLPPPPPPGR